MRIVFFLIFLAIIANSVNGQSNYWIFFTDKGHDVAKQLLHPEKLLSEEALTIRKNKGVSLDHKDLPVASSYTHLLRQEGLRILYSSRWLNAVAVEVPVPVDEMLVNVKKFGFVEGIRPMAQMSETNIANREGDTMSEERSIEEEIGGFDNESDSLLTIYDYGQASLQNNLINIAALHSKGFTGKGVRLAIFDAGFAGVDTIFVFDSLRNDGRIIAKYDFVSNDSTVFHASSHGTEVLSTIAALAPGEMVGTAPHVSVLLCRTEDTGSETRKEEYNWVAAMEWVDSIGVDIIHSSLGYTTFDNEGESYEYEDLDGNSTIITRAADIAASKGIIVTTSAGNEGAGRWRYISAPCDADSVLCIGSIDRYKVHSRFSSFGPTADGRIKPDVVALGTQASVASSRNTIFPAQGTSYSSPIVAGMVACLKQAHPDREALDVIRAVILSGDQYAVPDSAYGYGIPDAAFADSLLIHVGNLDSVKINQPETLVKGKPEVIPIEVEKQEIPVMAESPQSDLSIDKDILTLSTTSNIVRFQLMREKQKIVLDPEDITSSDTNIQVNIEYLLPGEHYIFIETEEYEENVKFLKP